MDPSSRTAANSPLAVSRDFWHSSQTRELTPHICVIVLNISPSVTHHLMLFGSSANSYHATVLCSDTWTVPGSVLTSPAFLQPTSHASQDPVTRSLGLSWELLPGVIDSRLGLSLCVLDHDYISCSFWLYHAFCSFWSFWSLSHVSHCAQLLACYRKLLWCYSSSIGMNDSSNHAETWLLLFWTVRLAKSPNQMQHKKSSPS